MEREYVELMSYHIVNAETCKCCGSIEADDPLDALQEYFSKKSKSSKHPVLTIESEGTLQSDDGDTLYVRVDIPQPVYKEGSCSYWIEERENCYECR